MPTATAEVVEAAGDEGAIVEGEDVMEGETAVAESPDSNAGIWLLGGAGVVALAVTFIWLRRR